MNTEHYGYGWTLNIMDMDEQWTLWIWMNTEHDGQEWTKNTVEKMKGKKEPTADTADEQILSSVLWLSTLVFCIRLSIYISI